LGLLALKRLDQFRAVEVCVVDEQPALGESINIQIACMFASVLNVKSRRAPCFASD